MKFRPTFDKKRANAHSESIGTTKSENAYSLKPEVLTSVPLYNIEHLIRQIHLQFPLDQREVRNTAIMHEL